MADQDPDTSQQQVPPAGDEGGPKGAPDLEAANKRLTAENANLKQANDDLQKQLDGLNAGLAKALTEDDVKAAVEAAQGEAKKTADAAEAAWKAREKALVVENALIAAGCTDTVGMIAHLDLDAVEVAKDGHVSGLDVAKAKESCPHLFDAGAVVSSAATPGGPAKKMTKDEIMGIKDPAERRAKIADNMDLFE